MSAISSILRRSGTRRKRKLAIGTTGYRPELSDSVPSPITSLLVRPAPYNVAVGAATCGPCHRTTWMLRHASRHTVPVRQGELWFLGVVVGTATRHQLRAVIVELDAPVKRGVVVWKGICRKHSTTVKAQI